MGFTAINDAQKIRISFSDKAIFTIEDDMTVFGVTSMTAFINTVITNFHDEAASSIFTYLEKYRSKLTGCLKDSKSGFPEIELNKVIDILVAQKETELKCHIEKFKKIRLTRNCIILMMKMQIFYSEMNVWKQFHMVIVQGCI